MTPAPAVPSLDESDLYGLVFGKVVCQLRERASLGQSEAAARVGMTQSTWSSMESGKARVGPFETAKIAEVLCLSTDQLHTQVQSALSHLKQSGTAAVPQASKADDWWVELLKVVGIIGLVGLVVFAVAAALGESTAKPSLKPKVLR